MISIEERDLLEELENRAWEYVFANPGCTPNSAIVSTDIFHSLQHQIIETTNRPLGASEHTNGLYHIVMQTSSGPLTVFRSDKYGDDFLFVGQYADLFPREGDCDLSEKIMLEEKQ